MANTVLLEARPYRPFKSSEEYLYAMREDLAEWLNILYPELRINTDNFMDRLDTGVALCKHANNVRVAAEEYLARRQARNKSMTKSMTTGLAGPILAMGNIHFLPAAKSGTFFARDNVSNFISWCRKSLQIFECLLFETDDLIMRKNEKHVILCLLEVARRGAKFGMLAPMLVQMERQIDREIAADNRANGVTFGTQTENGSNSVSIGTDGNDLFDSDSDDEDAHEEPVLMYGPQPQIVTNDLKSLDEMVRDLVEKCTCPSQFPMVRVSEGKYRIGDTKVLIFVRILRSHVMVRVGGGWDTLSHYLDKHDPCRCKSQHRSSVAARLMTRTNNVTNGIELHKAQVFYDRSPPTIRRLSSTSSGVSHNNSSSNVSPNTTNHLNATLSPPSRARSRSRSPTPHRKITNHNGGIEHAHEKQQYNHHLASPNRIRRSMSPSPRRIGEFKKKQLSLDSSISPIIPSNQQSSQQFEPMINLMNEAKIELANGTNNNHNVSNDTGKFDNISDNGSEISDEGYRSLGLIQGNNNNNGNNICNQIKRISLHSQNSTDDADLNARHDHTSSDSQISPIDDQSLKTIGTNESSPAADVVDDGNVILPPVSSSSSSSVSPQSLLNKSSELNHHENNFEKSGVFITDDEITITDIATSTGLRKTGFSDNLYGTDDPNSQPKLSKIPRSPIPIRRRRKSIDNSNVCSSVATINQPKSITSPSSTSSTSSVSASSASKSTASTSTKDMSNNKCDSNLPVISRHSLGYRSVRKPSTTSSPITRNSIGTTTTTSPSSSSSLSKQVSQSVHKDLNTWSGRTTKKRTPLNVDTFSPNTTTPTTQITPSTAITTSNSSNNLAFNRTSSIRGSQILYDKNGRRINRSTNSSPTKLNKSPLAQQILVAAGTAKNDAQIIEKMKELLNKYTDKTNGVVDAKSSQNNEMSNAIDHPDSNYDDFTRAWVNSNGKLDRNNMEMCNISNNNSNNINNNGENGCSENGIQQQQQNQIQFRTTTSSVQSIKRSSVGSSIDSTNSKEYSSLPIVTPPVRRGSSRIPALITRHNTEMC